LEQHFERVSRLDYTESGTLRKNGVLHRKWLPAVNIVSHYRKSFENTSVEGNGLCSEDTAALRAANTGTEVRVVIAVGCASKTRR